MARIFTDGFEMGDFTFSSSLATTIVASTSLDMSGAYVAKVTGQYVGGVAFFKIAVPTPGSELFIRFRYRSDHDADSDTSNRLMAWFNAGTSLGYLKINPTTNFIEAYVNTTLVATGTIRIYTNTTYVMELHIKVDDSGAIETKVDGIADITYAGDTKPAALSSIDLIGPYYYHTGGLQYFDDIAINNTSGGADNSWCGDGRIVALLPNANGDESHFVGSDGNSTDNYALVDEAVSNGDTDYVKSATPGDIDLYNVASIAAFVTGQTVRRVWVEARAKESSADAATLSVGNKTGTTTTWDTAVALPTSYTTVKGAEMTTSPDTGVAWTEANLNALQVGMTVP